MKVRIDNLNYDGVIVPIAEIDIMSCNVTSEGKGMTYHKVSSVRTIDGVEVVKELQTYNHPFNYLGGNVFQEAMQSLSDYLANPNT